MFGVGTLHSQDRLVMQVRQAPVPGHSRRRAQPVDAHETRQPLGILQHRCDDTAVEVRAGRHVRLHVPAQFQQVNEHKGVGRVPVAGPDQKATDAFVHRPSHAESPQQLEDKARGVILVVEHRRDEVRHDAADAVLERGLAQGSGQVLGDCQALIGLDRLPGMLKGIVLPGLPQQVVQTCPHPGMQLTARTARRATTRPPTATEDR